VPATLSEVVLALRDVFYTRNGEVMDLAFKNLTSRSDNEPEDNDIYPMIGLSRIQEHVHVNFGKEPFGFDIEGHLKRTKNHV
jgi:hypothetical protein